MYSRKNYTKSRRKATLNDLPTAILTSFRTSVMFGFRNGFKTCKKRRMINSMCRKYVQKMFDLPTKPRCHYSSAHSVPKWFDYSETVLSAIENIQISFRIKVTRKDLKLLTSRYWAVGRLNCQNVSSELHIVYILREQTIICFLVVWLVSKEALWKDPTSPVLNMFWMGNVQWIGLKASCFMERYSWSSAASSPCGLALGNIGLDCNQ